MEMLHVSTFETLYSGFKSYARRILGGFLEDSWRILGGFLQMPGAQRSFPTGRSGAV